MDVAVGVLADDEDRRGDGGATDLDEEGTAAAVDVPVAVWVDPVVDDPVPVAKGDTVVALDGVPWLDTTFGTGP